MNSLSAIEARRIALAAQGFAERRPAKVDRRALRALMARLGLLQIDSVNVLARAHYLPVFSRLGAYDRAALDALVAPQREHFEYWAHEASVVPVSLYPALHWRMERARNTTTGWRSASRLRKERPGFVEQVLKEIEKRGPLTAGELEVQQKRSGKSWWSWSEAKIAVEWLFWAGFVTTHSRSAGFERSYDVMERVLPKRGAPLSEAEGQRELLRVAARAHGVATKKDLRDYFRLSPQETRARIAELVDSRELEPVQVEGWGKPAWRWHQAVLPKKPVNARALLVPFDPLVFERSRTERIFGMRYRIEIYTPPQKRVFGYYVLPFLLGEQLVARVDLKADRQGKVLRVQAAHVEKGHRGGDVAEALRPALAELAAWLGLSGVFVERKGNLARAL